MKPIQFHFKEKTYSCGPCALRMILETCLNISIDEEKIISLLGTTESEGTSLALFKKNLKKTLEGICAQFNLPNQFSVLIKEGGCFADLQQLQHEGYLILLNYTKPDGQPHWAVFDAIHCDNISLMDPDFGPHYTYPLDTFNWTGGVKNKTHQALVAIKY